MFLRNGHLSIPCWTILLSSEHTASPKALLKKESMWLTAAAAAA
jgi:hypothetical protein